MELTKVTQSIDQYGKDGTKINEKIFNFIEEQKLNQLGVVKTVYRSVGIPDYTGISNDKKFFSDDVICEIIVNDDVVAILYLRRDASNYTECFFSMYPEKIEKIKESSLK